MNLLPRLVVSAVLVVGGGVLSARLAAQAVSLGETVWFSAGPLPDKLPERRKTASFSRAISERLVAPTSIAIGDRLRFSTPPTQDDWPKAKDRSQESFFLEMKKMTEIGYVVVKVAFDEKLADDVFEVVGAPPALQREVEETIREAKQSPGRRAETAVGRRLWKPVIFNPKSASVDGSEATPRLLKVTPIYVPQQESTEAGAYMVRLTLALDERGAITGVKAEEIASEEAFAAIREALKMWVFAPARRRGKPVTAAISMAVACEKRPKAKEAATVFARELEPGFPNFPASMQHFEINGAVELEFEVDATGRVRNPIIVSSDNPAFDEPAIVALRQMKFQPATRDGQPFAMKEWMVMDFRPWEGTREENYRVRKKVNQLKAPPDLRYDTAPVVRSVLVPVYPHALRSNGVSGNAKAAMAINPQGRVVGVKVLAAKRPEFGSALVAALEGFRFDPALKNGEAVSSVVAYEQVFSEEDLPDEKGDGLLATERKRPKEIVQLTALDGPLKPVSQRQPVFPVTVPLEMESGDAVIECLVDKEGWVRLPRVVSATHEAFGYAAVQAAAAWWFEPPLVRGKPVVARVQIPFKFGGTEETAKPVGAK